MSTLPKRLSALHPRMLRAESETESRPSEADPQKLADHHKRVIGQMVERALEFAHLTKQEAARLMGYSDAGVVSRWCSGIERPQFDKLLQLPGFEAGWMLALAERSSCVESETVIRIRRRA